MKKIWFVIVPVIVLALGAVWASTEQDRPSRPERKAFAQAFALAGNGYRLGVVLSEISPHLRDDLKIDSGVVIDEVLSDSPAEKAGLKDGDIIVSIDGNKVDSERDIRRSLRNLDEPKEVTVEIIRDGKPMQIRVTPEKREFHLMGALGGNQIGVELQELDDDLAKYFQTSPGAGILVTRVDRDSPAEKAGLKSGDVITEFNGKKITSNEQLRRALDDVEDGQTANVTVLRHGKTQQFSVKPETRQFHMPEIPELGELKNLRNLPEIRNLPNTPEFRESMEDLRREMEKLKQDMEDLRKELREQD